jgi:hypothetical protein
VLLSQIYFAVLNVLHHASEALKVIEIFAFFHTELLELFAEKTGFVPSQYKQRIVHVVG